MELLQAPNFEGEGIAAIVVAVGTAIAIVVAAVGKLVLDAAKLHFDARWDALGDRMDAKDSELWEWRHGLGQRLDAIDARLRHTDGEVDQLLKRRWWHW